MPLDLSYPPDETIVGWNSKLDMSSYELSDLVPFIHLVALFNDKKITEMFSSNKTNSETAEASVKRNDMLNRLFLLDLQKDDSGWINNFSGGQYLYGAVIGEIQSQINSNRYMGGVGITDLEVTRGMKESMNVMYDMKIIIADVDLMSSRPEFTTLAFMNSVFLIVYGWSSSKDSFFVNCPAIPPMGRDKNDPVVIDLSKDNNGFWKAGLGMLWKFEYSFANDGALEGSLNFVVPNSAAASLFRTSKIESEMKNRLGLATSNSVSTVAANRGAIISDPSRFNTTRQISSIVPSTVGFDITVKSTTTATPTPDQVNDTKPAANPGTVATQPLEQNYLSYYYLGWVLEALRASMINRTKSGAGIDFIYSDIDDSARAESLYVKSVQASAVGAEITLDRTSIKNVFQIPIDRSKVDSILTSESSVRSMVDEVIASHDIPGMRLATRMEGSKIKIFVESYDTSAVQANINLRPPDSGRYFDIKFASHNSLCENVQMSSQMDYNAFETYQLPIRIGTGTVNAYDLLEQANLGAEFSDYKARSLQVTGDANSPADPQVLSNLPDSDDTNSWVAKFIQTDPSYYVAIIMAMAQGNDMNSSKNTGIFSQLLGFYLRRTTVTIHGTVGLNAYQVIRVGGILRNLAGLYNILQVTDQVNTSSYSTVLECALLSPALEDI